MPLGAFQDLAVPVQGVCERGGHGEPPTEQLAGPPLCPPADGRDFSPTSAGWWGLGRKKKLCSWGKHLGSACNTRNGSVPKAGSNFYPIDISPGLSHTCPAAKTHFLLLPHLQKVFYSSFSLLHPRPFAPSSAPRHATSYFFSQAARG